MVPYDFVPRRHTPNINNEPGNSSPTETEPEAASSTLTANATGVSSINIIRYETLGLSATPTITNNALNKLIKKVTFIEIRATVTTFAGRQCF